MFISQHQYHQPKWYVYRSILIIGTKQTGSATAGHRSRQTTGQDDFDDGNVDDDAIPGPLVRIIIR